MAKTAAKERRKVKPKRLADRAVVSIKAKRNKSNTKRSARTDDSDVKPLTLNDRTLCNGGVVLFKRDRSKRWQCRIRRLTGLWIDYTTGEAHFDKAKAIAEEKYRDIKYRQETGKVDVSRRFGDVCKVARRELLDEYEKTGRAQLKDKVRVIDKYLIPMLGQYNSHNITTKTLLDFDGRREQRLGRKPSKSTINTHNSALAYVLNLAQAHNYILAVPVLLNSGAATEKRRLHFNDEEYRALCNFMWRDLKHSKTLLNKNGLDGKGKLAYRSYDIRELMRDVVLILANTGIRPGNELLRLKWSNLRITTQDGKESILFNLVKTKTHKQRTVVGYEPQRNSEGEKRYGCWSCLERIRDRSDDLKGLSWEELFTKDEHIFKLRTSRQVVRQEALTKNFKTLLQRCVYKGKPDGLLRDEYGNDRVLYSLRHTYASRRRYESMSFDDLSVQMGTSVELLEKTYSHFVVSDNPNLFSGHAKREQQRKADDADRRMRMLEDNVAQLVTQNAQLMKMLAESQRLANLFPK